MPDKIITWRVLLYASAMLVIVEIIAGLLIYRTGLESLLVTGLARIAEIGGFAFILSSIGNGIGSIGLTSDGFMTGLKKGLIWAIGFGVCAGIVFIILSLADYNPLYLFRAAVPASPIGLVLLFGIGGFIGPVAEEIYFRGIIYGFLRKGGVITAVAGSTVIFSLAHGLTAGLSIVQVIGGIVFAVAYEREKNLVVPIIIHILGNLMIFSISVVMAN